MVKTSVPSTSPSAPMLPFLRENVTVFEPRIPLASESVSVAATVPRIRTVMLPLGKLSVHEEFPDSVAETVEPFLRDQT
jgi:hypothetical protein